MKRRRRRRRSSSIDAPFAQIKISLSLSLSSPSAAKTEKVDFQLSNSELLQVHIVPSTSSEIETRIQKPPAKP